MRGETFLSKSLGWKQSSPAVQSGVSTRVVQAFHAISCVSAVQSCFGSVETD